MNELTLQIIASSKIVFLGVFTLLYGLGGISGKWKRRILGSLLLTAGIVVYSLLASTFSYWFILYAPLLYGALSIGYGGDELGEKILKRMRYGFLAGMAALPIAIVTGQWVMFGVHLVLCTALTTIYGVLNPVHARSEETIIATILGFTPLFMV